MYGRYSNFGTKKTSTNIETDYPSFDMLIDSKTGAIQPEIVQLRALNLFLLYAQQGTDRARAREQDLTEWFQKTSRVFESCQTLKRFFDCYFRNELDGFPNLAVSFPDLIKLIQNLEYSKTLLTGVDVFQLLEQLKQTATKTLYEEISRIYAVERASFQKKSRLIQQEKEKINHDYERLRKEIGISSNESNEEREIAEIAWRYFTHHLPTILNNIRFVNGVSELWKTWTLFTSVSWNEQLLKWLECSDFPYYQLPEQVKKALKIYLTSYANSNDFIVINELHKRLVGPPTIIRLQDSERNILRVTGGYLALNIILDMLKSEQKFDEIQILASETLFVNEPMDPGFSGVNIIIVAKTIDITSSITINTSGLDGKPHDSSKANDGRAFNYSASAGGLNGENGKPGHPGGSAGHVYIQASKTIINPHLLTIKASGGKGSNGQHGGLGDDGQDGQDGLDAEYYGDGSRYHLCRKVQINRGTRGTLGQPGGNGGDAGIGGQGGYAGHVVVRSGQEDKSHLVSISALPGADGIAGEHGEGGKAGLDGHCGVDKGAAFTGVSFRKNQFLAGLDVEAIFVKRPWYEKDYYELKARVPEAIAKTMPHERTNTHGKVGTSARCINAAAKQPTINVSNMLRQCPEIAANLSLNDEDTHEELNQNLDTLYGMRKQSRMLDSDMEEVEKRQNKLIGQQNKLEEIVNNLERERIQQNIAQQQRISQLADFKYNKLPLNDKTTRLFDLPFMSERQALESDHYQKIKKECSDFVDARRDHKDWCAVFEYMFERIRQLDALPSIEDIYLFFSLMALRETVSTLLPDLQVDDLSSWGSMVLLGNTKEKLHSFVASKSSDDIVNFSDYLEQRLTVLYSQPLILTIFYEKLTAETALSDPTLAISAQEVCDILDAFASIEVSDEIDFIKKLDETPFPGWPRLLRREALRLSLFNAFSPHQEHESQQKRCLLSLCNLEESIGKEKINRFVDCIKKAGSSVNYAILANLLMQLNYQQLTLDADSLLLLEEAPFKQWPTRLQDYHRQEIKKPRDLSTLLRIMQNEAANEKIWGWLSEIENQITIIHSYISGNNLSSMRFLFEDGEIKENSLHFILRSVNTWTAKDILAWSNAFKIRTDNRELVKRHFTELISIISRAIYLTYGFYPREVQLIALLIAYRGSDYAQKIISQIDTGEGKTIVLLMHALLRVFGGDKVNLFTSSSVLAEEAEKEISPICRLFGFTSACNSELNDGPYHLELIEGEPDDIQKEQLCNKKGVAIVKKGDDYFLALANFRGEYSEELFNLLSCFNLRKKMTEQSFYSHQCKASEGLHDEVLQLIRNYGLEELIEKHPSETQKLQQCYRSDILCGDLQSFMRAHLLTEFYGKNITQNRRAFTIIDEVDRLLDEMRDTLYLSHDIPDMHHLNNLLINIWDAVHRVSCDIPTEENIAYLTDYFSKKMTTTSCFAQQLKGEILVPSHMEHWVRKRLPSLIQSAYMAKNELSQDKEYIVEQIGEGSGRDVYLVDQETGVTSLNKKYRNGLNEFLKAKNGRYFDHITLMAIFCDPRTFLEEHCIYGFSGVTGTVGSKQDFRYFDKLFGISTICIVPRHTPRVLQVDEPILAASPQEQRIKVANLVREQAVMCGQPVEIFCDTIADVKALNPLLKKQTPEATLYERKFSFETFNIGSKRNPVKKGDVINGTGLLTRGIDLEVADGLILSVIEQSVFKHERAKKQADGRTARKGRKGRISFILCPQYGETSMEEMQDRAYLLYEQSLEHFRLIELRQLNIIKRLFCNFTALSREIETIIRHSGYPSGVLEGYVERQMAALRTHWAFWLDEVEQDMEEKGLKDEAALKDQFQDFSKKMRSLAQEKGAIKLASGPGEITRLGIWFGVENSFSSEALECFDYVIQHYYLFAGQSIYYKGYVLGYMAKHNDFTARKGVTKCLKYARSLIHMEIMRLQESADKMDVIANLFRQEGHGLYHNHFKESVYGMMQALTIIQNSIDDQIGYVTDVSFFLPDANDKKEAQIIYDRLIESKNIKEYHVSKNVIVENKNLFVVRINGKREEIQFPSELNEYKEKIINLIAGQQGNRESRSISYQKFCLTIFGLNEENADEAKKMVMVFSWQFLQLENILKPPVLNQSRYTNISTEKAKKSFELTDRALELALGKFRRYENIQFHIQDLHNLCERGTIPLDVFSFFKHYLEFSHIIVVEQKPVYFAPAMLAVVGFAAFQVLCGVALGMPFLIEQGIGDMVFLAMSIGSGDFSMEHYWRHKLIATSIAGAAICTKQALTYALEQSAKYQIGQKAIQSLHSATERLPTIARQTVTRLAKNSGHIFKLTEKLITCIPAPVLYENNPQTISTVFSTALKEVFKETATEMTMRSLLTTFTPNDIEKHVMTSLCKKIQLEITSLSGNLKKHCMRVLKHSESAEQGMHILQHVFATTLNEYIYERLSPLIDHRFFSMSQLGKIANQEIRGVTGKAWLGNIVEFLVTHAEKTNVTFQAINSAKGLTLDLNYNLLLKLEELKKHNKKQKLSASLRENYRKLIDDLIEKTLHQVSNKSLYMMGNTILRPVINLAYQKLVNKIENSLFTSSTSQHYSEENTEDTAKDGVSKDEKKSLETLDPALAAKIENLRNEVENWIRCMDKVLYYIYSECMDKLANETDYKICEDALSKFKNVLLKYEKALNKYHGSEDVSHDKTLCLSQKIVKHLEMKLLDYTERAFFKFLEEQINGRSTKKQHDVNDGHRSSLVEIIQVRNEGNYAANHTTFFSTANTKETSYQDIEEFFKRPSFEELDKIRRSVSHKKGIDFLTIMFGMDRAKELSYFKNTCSLRLSYYLNSVGIELPPGPGSVSYKIKDKQYHAHPRLRSLIQAVEKTFGTFEKITEENIDYYSKVQGIRIRLFPGNLIPSVITNNTALGHGELMRGDELFIASGTVFFLPLPTQQLREQYMQLKEEPHKQEFHLFCDEIRKNYFGQGISPIEEKKYAHK